MDKRKEMEGMRGNYERGRGEEERKRKEGRWGRKRRRGREEYSIRYNI